MVISPDIRVDNSGRIETVMLIVVSDLEKIIKFDMKDDLIGNTILNTILLDEENQILLKILRTLTTFLMDYANAQEGSWQTLAAGIIVIMIPTVLIYIFFQKYILAGVAAGAVKG